jgi:type III secretory pathway component EscS
VAVTAIVAVWVTAGRSVAAVVGVAVGLVLQPANMQIASPRPTVRIVRVFMLIMFSVFQELIMFVQYYNRGDFYTTALVFKIGPLNCFLE